MCLGILPLIYWKKALTCTINLNNLSFDFIGRGSAWLDTGSIESFHKTSNFVSAIENQQGFKIACLEEIAYYMGYIDIDRIKEMKP